MYIAELKNKLSSKLEKKEDILTSNVFSFFKYSRRTIFLKSLMNKLDLEISDNDLKEAQFIFWPYFENNTEPDLVLIAGDYYILFEAKLYSDFSQETPTTKAQLIREIEGGLNEARSMGKRFVLVALTADYYYKKYKFKDINNISKDFKFEWINWQSISELLLNLLEKYGEKLPDYLFAKDLYDLLERKKLRSYRSVSNLLDKELDNLSENIFFPISESTLLKDFSGFKVALLNLPKINKVSNKIFYSKKFFTSFNISNLIAANNFGNIFFDRRTEN